MGQFVSRNVRRVCGRAVWLRGSGEEVAGRLCVIQKSEEVIRRAQRRLRRKESKKQTKLKPETFEFCPLCHGVHYV